MKLNTLLISGFLIIALLVVVVGYISLTQLNKIAEPLNKDLPESIVRLNKDSHLDGLAQFIRYYDEVLTQSARNYAFTQDKKWEQRYRDVEPELDRTIKDAIEKGDEKDKEFFSSVDAANIALVEMEYNAIEYVNKGQTDEAVKILESSTYWDQKEIYEKGLRNYIARRGAEYDESLSASVETLDIVTEQTQDLIKASERLVLIFIIITLILAVGISLFISYLILKPLKKLSQTIDEISQGNLQVSIEKEGKIDEVNILTESLSRITKTMKLSVLEKESIKNKGKK